MKKISYFLFAVFALVASSTVNGRNINEKSYREWLKDYTNAWYSDDVASAACALIIIEGAVYYEAEESNGWEELKAFKRAVPASSFFSPDLVLPSLTKERITALFNNLRSVDQRKRELSSLSEDERWKRNLKNAADAVMKATTVEAILESYVTYQRTFKEFQSRQFLSHLQEIKDSVYLGKKSVDSALFKVIHQQLVRDKGSRYNLLSVESYEKEYGYGSITEPIQQLEFWLSALLYYYVPGINIATKLTYEESRERLKKVQERIKAIDVTTSSLAVEQLKNILSTLCGTLHIDLSSHFLYNNEKDEAEELWRTTEREWQAFSKNPGFFYAKMGTEGIIKLHSLLKQGLSNPDHPLFLQKKEWEQREENIKKYLKGFVDFLVKDLGVRKIKIQDQFMLGSYASMNVIESELQESFITVNMLRAIQKTKLLDVARLIAVFESTVKESLKAAFLMADQANNGIVQYIYGAGSEKKEFQTQKEEDKKVAALKKALQQTFLTARTGVNFIIITIDNLKQIIKDATSILPNLKNPDYKTKVEAMVALATFALKVLEELNKNS